MNFLGLDLKFHGFDVWHKGNFNPDNKSNVGHKHVKNDITDFPSSMPANGGNADTVDTFHLNQDVRSSASPTFDNIYVCRYYQSANGVPTSNLGNPSLTEMALFDAQFTNKLWFYNPAKFLFEYTTDGTNWVTQSVTVDQIKAFVSGNSNASISIPYGAVQYRITITNDSNYVYLNALYMYWSSNGHSAKVQIYRKRNDGDWIQHTSATNNVGAWPGHLYLPFNTIPWSQSTTAGHYNVVRIVFTPTWNSSYPNNGISLSGLELWGGYPSGRRTIYSWDSDKNILFPADIKGFSFHKPDGTSVSYEGHTHTKSQVTDMPTKLSQFQNDIGAGGGVKITTASVAPSSPSPGDFWYKEI